MPGGVVKKSAGSGMLGVLMGDASATDELAAAAVGMKLLKKGKKESQHRHWDMATGPPEAPRTPNWRNLINLIKGDTQTL